MIDGSSTAPLRERGVRGRRQRDARRTHALIAGIERQIPTYELLGEEGLARIEAAADAILQEIGIEFRGDEDALRLWRGAGAHFILHAAGWLEGGLAMGYEKLIMDADFCAALHVWMGGLKLDDNQLALDAFREVGPGKHFFGCAHTLANYETAFWDSAVADNNSFEQWRDEGMKDAPSRAAERCKRLLAQYEQPKLDPAIDEELADFVGRRKAERPDQWH